MERDNVDEPTTSRAFDEFTRQSAWIARQQEEKLRLRTALYEQRTELLERIGDLRKQQRVDFQFLAVDSAHDVLAPHRRSRVEGLLLVDRAASA